MAHSWLALRPCLDPRRAPCAISPPGLCPEARTLEGILDLLIGGLGLVPEQRVHAHDDAGGAEPTLGTVAFSNPLLKGTDDMDTCVGRTPLRISTRLS